MNIHRQNSINPQRRERLLNLAEFNRGEAAAEPSLPPVEVQVPHTADQGNSGTETGGEPAQ